MPNLDELAALLRRRLEVIADHAWRDRDPDAHLDGLKEASEAITRWVREHRAELDDPQLRHFLANHSYAKALAWVEGNTES